MIFIRDIWKWRLISVSNCQYRGFKNVMENQRNVTMTEYAVWNKTCYMPTGSPQWSQHANGGKFSVFFVGITSDYSYIFIENRISNMSYLFSYSRWHCTKSCCSWQVYDEGFLTVYASGLDDNRAGERNEATNLWRHHIMVSCIL